MISCEIIQDQDGILEYIETWSGLFDSGEYEASTSFEWTYALLKTHLGDADDFVLLIFRDEEDIVGIVPLIFSEKRRFGQTLVSVFPISEYYGTHSDILTKAPTDEFFGSFIIALSDLGKKWDVLRMKRLLESNPLMDHIEQFLSDNSIRYHSERTEPSFFITLEGNYTDYLKNRSGKLRNYLRRMEKKLKAKGSIEYKHLREYDNIADAYAQILQIEKNSWKHEHGTAISSNRKQEDFYKLLCDGTSQTGSLHLHLMYLNKAPIAYNMGLINNSTYLYLKTSFSDEFRKASPATVLRARLIEDLIDDGVKYFDFPGEPYEWERQWTEELRWHKALHIYNNTLRARMLFYYDKMKRMSRKGDDEERLRFHDPKALKGKTQ